MTSQEPIFSKASSMPVKGVETLVDSIHHLIAEFTKFTHETTSRIERLENSQKTLVSNVTYQEYQQCERDQLEPWVARYRTLLQPRYPWCSSLSVPAKDRLERMRLVCHSLEDLVHLPSFSAHVQHLEALLELGVAYIGSNLKNTHEADVALFNAFGKMYVITLKSILKGNFQCNNYFNKLQLKSGGLMEELHSYDAVERRPLPASRSLLPPRPSRDTKVSSEPQKNNSTNRRKNGESKATWASREFQKRRE